jgi:sugar phosphate isomerase/epimerase
MFTTLGPGAIGIKGLTLPESIALAKETGFEGVTFDVREAAALADERGIDHVRALFADAGVRPGVWGLPVGYRNEEKWQSELEALPRLTAVALDLGCDRATTGIMPGSNELAYDANFAWHVERLRPIAESLNASGCRLGIEFIAPKTLRATFKHEFVYTIAGIKAIAAEIGAGNVGVLLDIWHLYTSGDDLDTIDHLTNAEIVAVHVNDAPVGIPRDEQMDLVRALPLETGVLDLVGFMKKLIALGYDGPVMPEPFSKRVEEIAANDPVAAAQETARSMTALWQAAGLG